jgi:predicted transcriptional regulator
MTESSTTTLTAAIIAGYVKKNVVAVAELPHLINSIWSALDQLGKAPKPAQQDLKPAVPIRKSVAPDYIVCLEDGKRLKMLKRYLRTTYDMSPDQYRAKWGLPNTYPMVAPNYAASRSEMALKLGLGRKGGSGRSAPQSVPEAQEAPAKPRGRRKAAAA